MGIGALILMIPIQIHLIFPIFNDNLVKPLNLSAQGACSPVLIIDFVCSFVRWKDLQPSTSNRLPLENQWHPGWVDTARTDTARTDTALIDEEMTPYGLITGIWVRPHTIMLKQWTAAKIGIFMKILKWNHSASLGSWFYICFDRVICRGTKAKKFLTFFNFLQLLK